MDRASRSLAVAYTKYGASYLGQNFSSSDDFRAILVADDRRLLRTRWQPHPLMSNGRTGNGRKNSRSVGDIVFFSGGWLRRSWRVSQTVRYCRTRELWLLSHSTAPCTVTGRITLLLLESMAIDPRALSKSVGTSSAAPLSYRLPPSLERAAAHAQQTQSSPLSSVEAGNDREYIANVM